VRNLFGLVSLAFLVALPAAAQTQQPVRVKCGGPAYTDVKGQTWAADNGFDGGLVSQTTGPVNGTPDPALYQTGRTGPDSGSVIYTFPVVNGAYHVNLYFAELNPSVEFVGGRLFNVKLQGNPSLRNMDIFAAVGANAALVKGADVAVTNGSVQIELDNEAGHDRAKVTAIEITQTSKAPQLVLVFVYPDGTPVSGTLNYTMTTSLLKLGGSTPLVNGRADCVLFAAPEIMGLVGQVQLNLSLTDNAAHTLWQIGMNVDSTNVNLGNVQGSSLSVVVQKM
jgi:hypothetical protein